MHQSTMLAWTLFIAYLLGTTYLGYVGLKRTHDFSSFAIGDGAMNPAVVGITLAASTASAATFIVNPGFVYVHGLSAFMHLGAAIFAGILTMLFLSSYKFRRIGAQNKAVTIPSWLGKRYNSNQLSLYYGFVNLLSFAFLVLLVGGISIVMQELLGISNMVALLITLIFVTTYVIMGGTYAHVYTNLLQGSLMVIVSILVIASGVLVMIKHPDFWNQIANINPDLITLTNHNSNLYSDWFSIYISGFVIGAAVVCQPHILTKALYVKNDRDVTRYIMVFSVVYLFFTALLLVGFWALVEVPYENLIDESTGQFRQDLVMTQYLKVSFPDWLFTVISIVLLAAAMSTLDGLMVGLSTIVSNDIYLNIYDRYTQQAESMEVKFKKALRVSHLILVLLAICTFFVTLYPPKLLGIFGQFGVYALVLTSFCPILCGILFKQPSLKVAWASSLLAVTVYVVLSFWGKRLFPQSELAFANPAVPGAIAIIISTVPAVIIELFNQKKENYA